MSQKFTQEQIDNNLKEIYNDKFMVEDIEITSETKLVDDLGLDSLDMVELQMEVEAKFDMSIPDDEWEELSDANHQRLITFLHQKIGVEA